MYLLYRAIYNANYSTKKFQTMKAHIKVNTIIKRNNKKNTEENI